MFPKILAACVLLLGQAGPAAAQARNGRAPTEILGRTSERIASLSSLQFKSTFESNSPVKDSARRSDATVIIDSFHPSEPEQWTLVIRGQQRSATDRESERFELNSDREKHILIRHSHKQLIDGKPGTLRQMLELNGIEHIAWLADFDALVLRPVLKDGAAPVAVAGTALVDGVGCDIIRVDLSRALRPEGEMRWFISQNDSLPRRIEWTVLSGAGEATTSCRLNLTGVHVDEPVDPSLLRWTLPADYSTSDEVPTFVAPSGVGGDWPNLHWNRPAIGVPPGALAPANAAGQPQKLAELRGRSVVMLFWSSWAPQCSPAAAAVSKLRQLAGEDRLVLWALGPKSEPGAASLAASGVQPLLIDDSSMRDIGVFAFPTILIVDASGNSVWRQVGWVDGAEKSLTDAVGRVLVSPAVAPSIGATAPPSK